MSAVARPREAPRKSLRPTDLRTLILNADGRPLSAYPISLVPATVAVSALWRDRAIVVEDWPDAFFRSPSIRIPVPKTMMLKSYANVSGDPKFCRRSVLIRDRFRCFPSGTRVLMANGEQQSIDDVYVGDRVIDAFGVPQTVIDRGSRIADDCISIKHRGSYERTTVTPDHPFLDQNGRFTEIGKMEIADRRKGSYLSFPRRVSYELSSPISLNVPSLLPSDKWYRVKNGRIYRTRKSTEQGMPLSLPQSPDFAYLLGLYVAEGYASPTGPVAWCFSSDEETTLAADAARIIGEALGLKTYVRTTIEKHTCVVRTGSRLLGEIMWRYCGKGARNKRTPWELIGPYHTDYLRGLFAGDAHIDNKREKVVLSMTSSDAVFGAQSMLWGIGIFPTVQKIQVIDKLPAYTLVLNAENRTRFMRAVMLTDAKDAEPIFGNESHVLRRLQERVAVEGDIVVFNIEVDGSNSYIANGLAVHNCQYCGVRFESHELSYDHVRPRALGGRTEWSNIVMACFPCNAKKRDSLPNYSGRKGRPGADGSMRPLKTPRRPTAAELLRAGLEFLPLDVRETWADTLYWGVPLEP